MFLFDSLIDFVGDAVEVVGELAVSTVECVIDNPGKAALICVTTVATGGLASAFAAPIAASIGSTGLLGAAATGTAINSLSGIALTNASLAAIGGGSLAAGGGGIAAGVTVLTNVGAAAGAATSIGLTVDSDKED